MNLSAKQKSLQELLDSLKPETLSILSVGAICLTPNGLILLGGLEPIDINLLSDTVEDWFYYALETKISNILREDYNTNVMGNSKTGYSLDDSYLDIDAPNSFSAHVNAIIKLDSGERLKPLISREKAALIPDEEKCPYCGGEQWLWGYEIDPPDFETDNRYICPHCDDGRVKD